MSLNSSTEDFWTDTRLPCGVRTGNITFRDSTQRKRIELTLLERTRELDQTIHELGRAKETAEAANTVWMQQRIHRMEEQDERHHDPNDIEAATGMTGGTMKPISEPVSFHKAS